jgi:addiction module HigA family antidote
MAVTAIHPGEHLAEELKELSMSAAELARNLGVPTNRVTGILNGQRAITGDTALRLAHFFGTSAEFWLNLQSLYELRLAEKKVGKSIRALPQLKVPKLLKGRDLESAYRQASESDAETNRAWDITVFDGLDDETH